MPIPIISVENISKRYLVGHRVDRSTQTDHHLREVIVQEARNFIRKAGDLLCGRQIVQGDTVDEFWALRNVSFQVNEGEVLGVIGRNGAGKSTLLKILSRITEPTTGRISLRGRVASLLEVGTGFHPELSGRENIYLNGAILGMTRAEIRRKFDEIVAFAELDQFIDTPVKRYSSGMYVRLAFAVAAHLEPEILIVDEVLAVGDVEFQKKCLGKMDQIARGEGRTVLFVSHNVRAITELTDRTILLEAGTLVQDDRTARTLSTYLTKRGADQRYTTPRDEQDDVPHIAEAEVGTSNVGGIQYGDQPLDIRVVVRHRQPLERGYCLGIQIVNQSQVPALAIYAYPPEHKFGMGSGATSLFFQIPILRLNAGQFNLRIWLTEPNGAVCEVLDGVCGFEVTRVDTGIVRSWTADTCVYRDRFSVRIVGEESSHVPKSKIVVD